MKLLLVNHMQNREIKYPCHRSLYLPNKTNLNWQTFGCCPPGLCAAAIFHNFLLIVSSIMLMLFARVYCFQLSFWNNHLVSKILWFSTTSTQSSIEIVEDHLNKHLRKKLPSNIILVQTSIAKKAKKLYAKFNKGLKLTKIKKENTTVGI